MEKVVRTYTVSESRETISVTVVEMTDVIEQVILTDDEDTVVQPTH